MGGRVLRSRETAIKSFAPIVMSKQTESSPFRFAEIAKGAGLDFVHFSGMTDEKHFPTANGSGVAVFDYDKDGLLDIYFASATLLPLGTAEKGPNRLFKNLGNNRFKDVTEASGLGYRGFCHGIIAGDIDNDGDPDVFLCNYGSNVLYLNNGDGTFKDISKSAGIDTPDWSSGGAMLDYDNDGDLDIYVTNYGIWKYPEDHKRVGDAQKKVWLYSSPRAIRTTKHFFYRNNGNLTFTNVYDRVILIEDEVVDAATKLKTKKLVPRGRDDGHGFGVVAADVNNDGLIDLYIANDMNPNFLFLNRGDGTFEDATELVGCRLRHERPGAVRDGGGCRGRQRRRRFPSCSSPTSPTSTTPSTRTWARATSTTTRPSSAWPPTRCRGSAGAARWRTSTTTAGPIAS